jgi:ribosomal protein L30/L7E
LCEALLGLEKVEEGKIKITYCATTEMIADIFTKPLGPILFAKFVKALGLRKI